MAALCLPESVQHGHSGVQLSPASSECFLRNWSIGISSFVLWESSSSSTLHWGYNKSSHGCKERATRIETSRLCVEKLIIGRRAAVETTASNTPQGAGEVFICEWVFSRTGLARSFRVGHVHQVPRHVGQALYHFCVSLGHLRITGVNM